MSFNQLNVETGVEMEYVVPVGMYLQEPQFIARPGATGEDGVALQLPDSRLTYFQFFVRETFPFLDHLKRLILSPPTPHPRPRPEGRGMSPAFSTFYSENEKVWRQRREPVLICVALRACLAPCQRLRHRNRGLLR